MILTKDEAICLVLSLADQPLTQEQLNAGLIKLDDYMIPTEFTPAVIEEKVKSNSA